MWKKAVEQMGSQLHMTSGNRPEANGQTEQMNRVVQHLLRHYIKPNQDDWDEKFPLIASLYNNAVHNTTNVSPNQLHLGWKLRSVLNFLLPENRTAAAPGTIEFGVQYEKLLQRTVEHIKKSQEAMIAYENKHRRQSTFQVGERVWVKASELGHEFGISRKLMPRYFGPCEVLDIVGNDLDGPSYVIRIPGHLRTYLAFHASKLAPFVETAKFPSQRSMLPPTMDGHVDVDDILDHRDTPVPKSPGRGRPPKPAREYKQGSSVDMVDRDGGDDGGGLLLNLEKLETKDGGDLTALVLYHYPCSDGVSGALAAHLYHKAIGAKTIFFPHPVYLPPMWSDLLPLLDDADIIYLIDFSGPRGFALALAQKAAPKAVVILDHHKSAAEELLRPGRDPISDNLFPLIDMNRSGATMAYDYFLKKLLNRTHCGVDRNEDTEGTGKGEGYGSQAQSSDCGMSELLGSKSGVGMKDRSAMQQMVDMKPFFAYIEDADLWRWKLPASKAFSAGLRDLDLEYDARSNPKIFDQLLSLDFTELTKSGQSVLAEREVILGVLVNDAFEIEIRTDNEGGGDSEEEGRVGGGVRVLGRLLASRADGNAHLRSELGNRLAMKAKDRGLRAMGAVVYAEPQMKDESKFKVSLRSSTADEDTTEISQEFGGGGHVKASSFIVDRALFDSWRVF
ncbi:hypothetical protein CBR_g4381 [Chara braunii]|uniref:Integrase catalytic domain-containing protein n=1 Tax=Chara braunii TaxID=69332 RepID=A0A388KHR6_CHABU|nr:hypothetical protein CBR_g4381 [Chara braunii]|eukprot:GBG69547.1 hypothetical protein CBR_g4381 [Chara braunii]